MYNKIKEKQQQQQQITITSKVKCAHSDQISLGFRVGQCYVQLMGPATTTSDPDLRPLVKLN